MRVKNPAWYELKRIFFVSNYDGVAGIVATLISSNYLMRFSKKVDYFCFALVAPLGSDDD